MRRIATTLAVAALLAALAVAAIAPELGGPVRWTPDGLFYQARSLELQGTDRTDALRQVFGGPEGAELRRIDPERSGDPEWVAYNAQFYERRVAVPLAAAALEPLSGERAILDISLAGYVAAILAIFALLLLRFSLPVAGVVSAATVALPALSHHAGFPLTDSWGLALETAAFAAAMLVLRGGRRWLVVWAAVILVLSFTRDSMWIPLLAAAWLALTLRSRLSLALLLSGLVAALPVLLSFAMPMRELLAVMLNDFRPAPGAGWDFILERYPGALVDFARAEGGFIRRGEWYSALYLAGGLLLLFVATRGSAPRDPAATLLKAGAVAGLAYVLAIPVFSAFRLELVLVPMAAFGLGLGLERVSQRLPAANRLATSLGRRPARRPSSARN